MLRRITNLYKRFFWNPIRYARSIGVKVGEGCSFGSVSFGTEPYLVEIGNHVQLTSDVKFFTHGAAWVYRLKEPEFDVFGKIRIKNNVYVGNNVLFLPGVVIESNCIIGAGSVVTKSVPEGKIIGGNPAKIIGDVQEYYKKASPFNINTKSLSLVKKRAVIENLENNNFIQK